uniref:Protein kinase domain-containing protein n=1 Tax=Peronospora matthiolae TaxID=2874970 RepID=A0AAV1T7K3_9STRA
MASPGRDVAIAASPCSTFELLDESGRQAAHPTSPALVLPPPPRDKGLPRSRVDPSPSLRRLYHAPSSHSDAGESASSDTAGAALTREQIESISDLFPVTGAGVFTNPLNIVPTRDASILIDTDVQHAAARDAGLRLCSSQQQQQQQQQQMTAIGGTCLTLPSILMELRGDGGATKGTASIPSSIRNVSLDGDVMVGHGNTPREMNGVVGIDTLNHGLERSLPAMEPAARRARCMWRVKQRVTCQFCRQLPLWRPQETLVLLWKRMIPNWDSLVLKLVLLLAVLSVLAAVGSAALLSQTAPKKVHMVARCTAPGSMQSYSASTAYVAGVLIPAMNNIVFLVVSLWLGVLCSRSRKRVLRSAPCSISSNLKSAFMLPCYEAIWYTIAVLSAIGLILYTASFQAYRSESGKTYSALTLEDDPKYPCNIVTMPTVWVLQLLPMLMIQRSVSQEAVLRAIAYSGAVVVVLIVCSMTLFKVGDDIADATEMTIYILLLLFYFWAKFVFHARASFDFFFVAAVVSSLANIAGSVMGLAHMDETIVLPVAHCIVTGLDALIVVAVLLSLRADTRYWLAIDDNGSGTTGSKSAIRRYVNLLSERGMITNFSTRTSVYDVHQMIEEHRHNVVDFSALALDCIIAQGATSVVMRGTLRRSTPVPIALKIYTDVQVTNEEVQRFSRETALNVQLSHPNVVHFYGLCVVPPSISLIFEFCEYGALDAILREQPEIWTLAAKLKAWLDACRAVAYLHSFSPPLLHRDIKTDNFLVGQDFIIKLADFGEANLLQPRTDGTMTIAGTVDYMAPEMIKGGKTARYGTAVDVYSLMITLWQIMVPEQSPWEARSHLEVYRRVTCGDRPPLLPSIPKACADILEAGWAANPNDRAAVEDIIPSVHRLWLLALHQKPLKRTKH